MVSDGCERKIVRPLQRWRDEQKKEAHWTRTADEKKRMEFLDGGLCPKIPTYK